MKCKIFDSFLEIRDSIVTYTNYINNKVKCYVLNHIQLILTYVCEPKWYFYLDNFLTNYVVKSANVAIKKWIKSKTSPKLVRKKFKNHVKIQFKELKKSFYKGE